MHIYIRSILLAITIHVGIWHCINHINHKEIDISFEKKPLVLICVTTINRFVDFFVWFWIFVLWENLSLARLDRKVAFEKSTRVRALAYFDTPVTSNSTKKCLASPRRLPPSFHLDSAYLACISLLYTILHPIPFGILIVRAHRTI